MHCFALHALCCCPPLAAAPLHLTAPCAVLQLGAASRPLLYPTCPPSLPLDRSYHGEPLEEPMAQLAVNALQYYLSQGEVEKEWSESY